MNDKDLNGYRNEGKEPGEGEGDGRRYPVDGGGGQMSDRKPFTCNIMIPSIRGGS